MQRLYVVFWGMHLSSTSLDEHLFTSRLIDFDVVEYILIKDNFCVSGFLFVCFVFLNKTYFKQILFPFSTISNQDPGISRKILLLWYVYSFRLLITHHLCLANIFLSLGDAEACFKSFLEPVSNSYEQYRSNISPTQQP